MHSVGNTEKWAPKAKYDNATQITYMYLFQETTKKIVPDMTIWIPSMHAYIFLNLNLS